MWQDQVIRANSALTMSVGLLAMLGSQKVVHISMLLGRAKINRNRLCSRAPQTDLTEMPRNDAGRSFALDNRLQTRFSWFGPKDKDEPNPPCV